MNLKTVFMQNNASLHSFCKADYSACQKMFERLQINEMTSVSSNIIFNRKIRDIYVNEKQYSSKK